MDADVFFAIFCQTEAAGGSQDHLVCPHPLTIFKDQSHTRKVLLLHVRKFNKHDYEMVWGNTQNYIISRWILLCLARTPLTISKSQTSHFLVSWTFITCCLKMYAVLKVFSQLVHFDSFFLWYCLKCLWKRGKVPKSFPHSGHSMSFWMFMVQRFCPNWKKIPKI